MARILYLTHVSWKIIKQRPQFIAECLSEYCEIDVYYKGTYKTPASDLKTKVESKERMTLHSYQILPFDKFRFFDHVCIDFVNRLWMKRQLPKIDDYDYVWISSPYTYRFVKNLIPDTAKIIYDCMDDYPMFPDIPQVTKKHMLKDEKILLQKAYKVFCTSNFLGKTIKERTGIDREITISNNGIKLPERNDSIDLPDDIKDKVELIKKQSFSLLYIGVISEWFDFEMILKSLNCYDDMYVFLAGPVKTKIPQHPRMHVLGTVERKYIFELMKAADALIMPFVVNDLIKSVNPVKLYEYIYSEKPVVSVRYSETEYFKEFVYLYNGIEEFNTIINKIRQGDFVLTENKKSSILSFIKNNTWESRGYIISRELAL